MKKKQKSTRSRPQIAIDVPELLHARVKAKAQREGISVRALILAYLQAWSDPTAREKKDDRAKGRKWTAAASVGRSEESEKRSENARLRARLAEALKHKGGEDVA